MLLLLLCAVGVRGLYFHIGETEKRCFIEEIPDETMVIGQAGWGWAGPCVSLRRGRGPLPSAGAGQSRRTVTSLSLRRELPHPDVG